jgi:integrase/recombinase XerD
VTPRKRGVITGELFALAAFAIALPGSAEAAPSVAVPALAGSGNLSGLPLPADSPLLETFSFDYGTGDQLVGELRERASHKGAPALLPKYKRLAAPKYFFRWLAKQGYLGSSPASELDMPRLGRRLPGQILTAQEAEKVLAQADLTDPIGIRDRAILETFYSTGIRRGELVRLKLYDIGFERGTLMIREGKGQKDRVVPIGERALKWLEKYLLDIRPHLVVPPDEGVVFLTYMGVPFHPDALGHEMKKYILASGVGKEGACHIFRHTVATLMLDGGADIRYVQEMLGHTKLETTSIYTQVTIDKLKKIHDATHPAARLSPRGADPGTRLECEEEDSE